MMTTAVDAIPWALTADHVWHSSVSNLELCAWTDGRTLCHLRVPLSRTELQPSPRVQKHVCRECVVELLHLAEPLPRWMARLAQ